MKNFVQYIKDDSKRDMIESILSAFQQDIIDSGVSESFENALIHGDFNDANVLVDDDFRISGVLDFGDSVQRYVWTTKRFFSDFYRLNSSCFVRSRLIIKLESLA